MADGSDGADAERSGRIAGAAPRTRARPRRSKRADALLRESEARYRAMTDAIPVLIWEAGVDARCTYVNRPWLGFTGHTLAQSLGDGWTERVHPDDLARCLDTYHTAYAAREPFTMEFRLCRHDGEYRWMLDNGVPRFAEDGAFIGYIGSCVDITERKHLERDQASLIAASRAFATTALEPAILLDTIAASIGAITGEGCILRLLSDDERLDAVAIWHPHGEGLALVRGALSDAHADAAARLPGRVIESGEPLLLVAPPGEDLGAQVAPSFRLYVERFRVTALLILPLIVRGRAIGTLSLAREGDLPPYTDDEQLLRRDLAGRAALAIDNALRYAAERAARAEAEAANRARDEFLSVLSHELRTPLTPIIGLTQLLLRRPPVDANVTRALTTIDRNARAQARLVEDLLDVSRIITGKLQIERHLLDLNAVVEAALAAIRPAAAAKGVALEVAPAPPATPVVGDRHRLQQVLWNLLSNAVKFTPAGGHTRVTLTADGHEAQITVADTGIGIESEFLPFLFDRFRQADASSTRAYSGLGLGLAIVRHLVELHGGWVTVASEGRGLGAAFTVGLPLIPSDRT